MQKRRFTALLAGLVTSAALGLAMPASAQPYQDEYKLSTVLGEAFPWGWGAKRWVVQECRSPDAVSWLQAEPRGPWLLSTAVRRT